MLGVWRQAPSLRLRRGRGGRVVPLRPALLVRQSLALTRRLRTPMVLDRGKHKRCQRQAPHR